MFINGHLKSKREQIGWRSELMKQNISEKNKVSLIIKWVNQNVMHYGIMEIKLNGINTA